MGYQLGSADGVMGARTKKALKDIYNDMTLENYSGRASNQTLLDLEAGILVPIEDAILSTGRNGRNGRRVYQ